MQENKEIIDVIFIAHQINEKNEVLYENEEVIVKGSNFYNQDHNTIFYNTSTFLYFFPDTNKDLLWTLEPVSVIPANFSMDILKYFPALFNWNRKLLDKMNQGVYLPHQIYKKESDFNNFKNILNGFNDRKREILFVSNIKKSMHDSGMYQIRLDAADWFCSNSDFEVSWYGSIPLNRPYYKGTIENKLERIKESQFLFCPENCYDEYYSWDYLTEKLFDGFLGQAIPIYAGCYNIESYFPSDFYVDLRNYNLHKNENNNFVINYDQLNKDLMRYNSVKYESRQKAVNDHFLNNPNIFFDRLWKNIYAKVAVEAKIIWQKKGLFGYIGKGREAEKHRIEEEKIFAGDFYIKYELEKLIKKFGVKSIIETGTAEGKSTLEMSSMVETVYTIELNEQSYNTAKERLNQQKNVKVFLGNSAEVLPKILDEIEYPALFYLDAHWFDYWPILDELEIISQSKQADKCLIFIHDFLVPSTTFGYDIYNNQPLDINYVKEKLFKINKTFKYYYNKKALGKKRGVLYAHPAEITIINNPLTHVLIDDVKQTEKIIDNKTYENIIINYVAMDKLKTINSKICEVDSEFVLFSKNGNLYSEEIIENCLKTFMTNPKLDILFINDENDKSAECGFELLKLVKLRNNDFFVRRHIFEEIGFFDELENEILEFLLRFFEVKRFNIGLLDVQGHKTANTKSIKQKGIFNDFINHKQIDVIFSEFNWIDDFTISMANAYLTIGLCLIELDDYNEGMKYFGMSFKVVPDINNLIQITNVFLLKGKVKELYLLINAIKKDFKEVDAINEIEELLTNYMESH